MTIKKAWAVYEWKLFDISLDERRLLWVASSEVAADSLTENAPAGFCRASVEVVVAVDGDECTILGKWEPIRFSS